MNPPPVPAAYAPLQGFVAPGFEEVARVFAAQFTRGAQTGASFAVTWRGATVVDLWGGQADLASARPWQRDTRICVFSVTKGFMAMAFHLLADRGLLDWDAPVAHYWPGFARSGKAAITVADLFSHRAGLAVLDARLTLNDVLDPTQADRIRDLLEAQAPLWQPGTDQGYHAITIGMYAAELFTRIVHEDMGTFLRRELFEPLESDVFIGTPPSEDARIATLYPPPTTQRITHMLGRALTEPTSAEALVFKSFLSPSSLSRRALINPSTPKGDPSPYNAPPARRAVLPWASATASARGIARAYLPFALNGTVSGRTYLAPATLAPLHHRAGWSTSDRVLMKPMGWTRGFIKEERYLFSPNPASFGHPGLGGALGWCDPTDQLTIGYAMNRMDWRVRSLRALELCRAVYESSALLDAV